jgi:hypothetical protein
MWKSASEHWLSAAEAIPSVPFGSDLLYVEEEPIFCETIRFIHPCYLESQGFSPVVFGSLG